MDRPENWETVIMEMQHGTGKEFFLCDIDKNEDCKKRNCIRYGGECFLTTNKKYAKESEDI